jgi:hypothetical protein
MPAWRAGGSCLRKVLVDMPVSLCRTMFLACGRQGMREGLVSDT